MDQQVDRFADERVAAKPGTKQVIAIDAQAARRGGSARGPRELEQLDLAGGVESEGVGTSGGDA